MGRGLSLTVRRGNDGHEWQSRSFSHGNTKRKPTSEIVLICRLPVLIIVHAVVHAHPPLAAAFTIAGISLAQCVLPKVVINLGAIRTTAYATPSTAEGSDVILEFGRQLS